MSQISGKRVWPAKSIMTLRDPIERLEHEVLLASAVIRIAVEDVICAELRSGPWMDTQCPQTS